ncbi:MAG TPA: hypothetical protein DD381_09735, partial [Lentisphaeria bacterium]|nr:hypothetical protein [Lentisphaeria bacterium]
GDGDPIANVDPNGHMAGRLVAGVAFGLMSIGLYIGAAYTKGKTRTGLAVAASIVAAVSSAFLAGGIVDTGLREGQLIGQGMEGKVYYHINQEGEAYVRKTFFLQELPGDTTKADDQVALFNSYYDTKVRKPFKSNLRAYQKSGYAFMPYIRGRPIDSENRAELILMNKSALKDREKGWWYYDLSSQNYILQDGEPYICDFGRMSRGPVSTGINDRRNIELANTLELLQDSDNGFPSDDETVVHILRRGSYWRTE